MDAHAKAKHQLAVMKRQLVCMSKCYLSHKQTRYYAAWRCSDWPRYLVAVPTVEANHASILGVGGGSDDMDVDSPAVVPVVLETRSMKYPKMLHNLWTEY
jgi:hypothetical protein